PHLTAVYESGLLPPGEVDVVLTTTSFSAAPVGHAASVSSRSGHAGSVSHGLDAPVLQAIFCSSSENVWAANAAGLTPRDIAMNRALPEFDGRIITTAVSFKNAVDHDARLQTDVVRYHPRADRVEHVAALAASWARLRHTPRARKRVAVLLA